MPEVWGDPEKANKINQKLSVLERIVNRFHQVEQALSDLPELIDMTAQEDDEAGYKTLCAEAENIEKQVAALEFARMFSKEEDQRNAYLDIQAGSGGTEAQDWAEMIMRMYLRWGDRRNFTTQVMDVSHGEVAGIKSATIKFSGEYVYGWLRTETGVHRLVRKSPFDSGNRRHTSFASVFVSPEVDDSMQVDINPADLRVDTYRSSGAGGQHVNTTDSAVRITHVPTGVVVQCQSDRSQHKNRAQAMRQMQSKLHQYSMREKYAEQDALEAGKSDISWGNQIRSYVLDASRIKDLRTGVETGNTQAVLDGDLDQFIEASLKMGVGTDKGNIES